MGWLDWLIGPSTPAPARRDPLTYTDAKPWASEVDNIPARVSTDTAQTSGPVITLKTKATKADMQVLPKGAKPLPQKIANNPEITNWAIEVVHKPDVYPMGSVNFKTFGDKNVIARVEHHTWTHRNGKLITGLNPPIRGATMYLAPGSDISGELAAITHQPLGTVVKDNVWPIGGAVAGFIVGGPLGAIAGGVGAYFVKKKVL